MARLRNLPMSCSNAARCNESCVFNVICPYKIVVVVSDKISYQKCMFLASVIFDSKLVRLKADTRTCAAVAHVCASIPNWCN